MATTMTSRASQPTYRGMSLDQAIEHEVWTKHMAQEMAKLPSTAATKEAAEFFLTEDLTFVPTKAKRNGDARVWEIVLPAETGRKMKRGMKLQLVERELDGPMGEFCRYSYRVRISRFRRFIQPKYMNWTGVTFFGTWYIQIFKYDASISCVYSREDLAKYTNSIS